MLLQCDICKQNRLEVLKVPCGYYLERDDNGTYFVMPMNEERYRDICLECIFKG